MDLEVSLTPEGSFYVREGRVELVCVETTYRNEEEGQSKNPHVWWQSEASFLHEERVLKRQSYCKTFKFTLPSDAPPSLQGAYETCCANISWRVKVSLDIAGAQDFHQGRELAVLPLVPEPATPVPKEGILEQCAAWLSLSSTTVRAGEIFDGRFKIQFLQDLRTRGVRVELERWEKAGDGEKSTGVGSVFLHKHGLVGELLAANHALEFDFQLHVPENAFPSTEFHDTRVVWRVKGIVDRVMRPNLTVVQQEIQVYTAPNPSQSSSYSGSVGNPDSF